MTPPANSLAYRLPSKVIWQEELESLILIRRFPLKTIRLHPVWKAVFFKLISYSFVSLDEIAPAVKDIDPHRIEIFLNGLVRKGFLESRGVGRILQYPFVTVIIPVYNRPEDINTCLTSLTKLDYPSDKLEIIVVDDASCDHTLDVIKKFNVRLISLRKNRQAPFCRNLAARKAKGNILAFIDSDCVASPSWLSELVPAFIDQDVGAVGGQVDSFYSTSWLDKYEQIESSLMMGTHEKRSGDNDNFFYIPSCNLLVRREVFAKVNGFNDTLIVGEDVDLCWRIQDAGHQVEFKVSGNVAHKHRNRLSAFCKRRFEYGTSEPMLQKMHKNREKKLMLPIWGVLFWLSAMLLCVFPSLIFAVICVLSVLIDYSLKYTIAIKTRIRIKKSWLFFAICRRNGVLLNNFCAFLSRYYLVWLVFLTFVLPGISILFLLAHIMSGLVKYCVKKPSLNLLGFLFYYTLDQLSYQVGVWFGCLKYKSFNAINPKIVLQV